MFKSATTAPLPSPELPVSVIVTFSDPKPVNLPEAYTAFALVIVVPVPLIVCIELASIVPLAVSYTHLTLPTILLV